MKRRFSISPWAVLLMAAVYFAAGIKAVLAVLISVVIHELGHSAAIKLFGGKVVSVRFDSSGLCMDSNGIESAVGELIVLASGPAAGLIFAAICSHYPENGFAVLLTAVGFVLTAYNLLPVYPLDGGRMVYTVLSGCIGRKKCADIMYLIGIITGTIIAVCGLLSLAKDYGTALLIAGVWLLIAQTGIVKSMRLL